MAISSRLIHLTYELTENSKYYLITLLHPETRESAINPLEVQALTVAFIMRCSPGVLHPLLVWFLSARNGDWSQNGVNLPDL